MYAHYRIKTESHQDTSQENNIAHRQRQQEGGHRKGGGQEPLWREMAGKLGVDEMSRGNILP